jgi:cobalt-zinc-cadmium efflux system protein
MTAAWVAWAALALCVAGLLTAFVARTLAMRRATGDSGLRLRIAAAERPTARSAAWGRALLAVACVGVPAGPLSAVLGLPALPGLDRAWFSVTGLVVAATGVVAALVAQAGMGRSWRVGVDPGERTDLVTGGVFALVRNPFFAATVLAAGGLALAAPTPVSFAALAVLVLAVQVQVRAVEEPYLLGTHGDGYRRYAERVGRFVPGVGRLRPAAGTAGKGSARGAGAGHDHGHDHGHVPATLTGRHRWRLAGALGVALVVFVVQVVGAVVSGSLGLLADAGHVLTDAGGVALALGASILASRPVSDRRTYGWARAEVLAAAVNGLLLLGIGGFVLVEGVRRLLDPAPVAAATMLAFAVVGLVGNSVGVALLWSARDDGLTMRGAFLEVATDTVSSVGVIAAAAVVATTGFTRADAVVSLLIAAAVLPRALRLLRRAVEVLLEEAPEGVDLDEIRRHIRELDHVRDVHDLHVHTVTSGVPVLTAHVAVDDECFRDGHAARLLCEIQTCMAGHFDIEHSTVQVEAVGHAAHERMPHA